MRSLNIAIVDLVTNRPTRSLWSRFMNANLASIMSQAAAVWCEEMGHRVKFICFTGRQDLLREIGTDADVVIVAAFTRSAQTAYALSAHCRANGAVTILGGPHARCYPDDARRYFDAVLGFTDRSTLAEALRAPRAGPGPGIHLSAAGQPNALPSAEERWKYIAPILRDAPRMLICVQLFISLGCPYQCPFCIDSTVRFQPLDRDQLFHDLRFVQRAMPDAVVGWHDPNFGVRFDEYMATIEAARDGGSLRFIAESSLSLLSEANVRRMAAAGFVGLLPGIESWYGMGFKSKTGASTGIAKVEQVAAHVNMLIEHVPYVQTNFVLGLDDDEGAEPFELTKAFVDKAPGAFPAYSQRTAFGEATPENLELQKAGRVLGFPFHFLDNNQVMNVVPKNYRWTEFYDNLLGLTEYTFRPAALARRWGGSKGLTSRTVNLVRAISSEGYGRIAHYRRVRRALDEDPSVRAYLERETDRLPDFYRDKMRTELGPMWDLLPAGAAEHDPYAFLRKSERANAAPTTNRIQTTAAAANR